jgi:hypothetical protein
VLAVDKCSRLLGHFIGDEEKSFLLAIYQISISISISTNTKGETAQEGAPGSLYTLAGSNHF